MDDERDACALVAIARKDGAATREVLAETIRGLECLAHRSGSIDGEGDGSGVLTDIPRDLWADELAAAGLDPSLALEPRFAVAHLFAPNVDDAQVPAEIRVIFARHRIRVLAERHRVTRSAALGPRAKLGEPRFWQVALEALGPTRRAGGRLYRAGVEIERPPPASIGSRSRRIVACKMTTEPGAPT